MGFGHRIYRAEDPRARVLRRTAEELGSPRFEVADAFEQAALEALREAHPERELPTNVDFWAAVVLDLAHIPYDMYPPMFGCARVAGWSAHILEQRNTGRLIRPRRATSARPRTRSPKRDARRSRGGSERARRAGRRACARRPARAMGGRGRARGSLAGLPRARRRLPRDRAVPLPAEDRAAPPRARGREPGLPRLGCALARESFARAIPASSTAFARCSTSWRRRDGNQAVRRLAIVSLKNGSADRATIQLLEGLGGDDEEDKELRDAASKVAASLKRKAKNQRSSG